MIFTCPFISSFAHGVVIQIQILLSFVIVNARVHHQGSGQFSIRNAFGDELSVQLRLYRFQFLVEFHIVMAVLSLVLIFVAISPLTTSLYQNIGITHIPTFPIG